MIATLIKPHVAVNLEYKVANVQQQVRQSYNTIISYKKAWHGRRITLESPYRNWECNILDLPAYMGQLLQHNTYSVVVWKFEKDEKNLPRWTFRYVLWSFGPCKNAYQYTFPVVTMDGAHLRGSYKGKLLVAVTKTTNNHILPLAYALVDEESTHSWTWFFKHLRHNVLLQRRTCIISDRHAGIQNVVRAHFEKFPRSGWHRYCLRHLRNNLMDKFKTKGIKKACAMIANALTEDEYNRAWTNMQTLNPNACEWLRKLQESKWTLYKDGGHRWGITTTNTSESHNNTLKNCRFLPTRAIVASTLQKSTSIFETASNEINRCGTFLPPYHYDNFMQMRLEAWGNMAKVYSEEHLVYSITTSASKCFTVFYRDLKCSCGVWQAKRFPCSHAVAICLQRQENPAGLVHQCFTCQSWPQQFVGRFYPVENDVSMVDIGWKLVPNYQRISQHEGRGRRRMERFRMSMDYQQRSDRGKKHCTRCHSRDHIAYDCPVSHPRSDRVPLDRIYNVEGEHDKNNDEVNVDGNNDSQLIVISMCVKKFDV